MESAIMGAGKVGSVLGRRWGAAGHRITFGVRDASQPHVVAAVAAAGPGARAVSDREAARGAEVIVLATPWHATERGLGDLGNTIRA